MPKKPDDRVRATAPTGMRNVAAAGRCRPLMAIRHAKPVVQSPADDASAGGMGTRSKVIFWCETAPPKRGFNAGDRPPFFRPQPSAGPADAAKPGEDVNSKQKVPLALYP